MKHKIFSSLIIFIGFILSPVSWWNDLIVNFPISYLLALPAGYLNKSFFIPAFIISYWITNIVGLILMHVGLMGLRKGKIKKLEIKQVIKTVFFGMLYTILIVTLILTGVLQFPDELLNKL